MHKLISNPKISSGQCELTSAGIINKYWLKYNLYYVFTKLIKSNTKMQGPGLT